jgi:hypothetical protein
MANKKPKQESLPTMENRRSRLSKTPQWTTPTFGTSA